jgi:hypothetical protein
VTDARLRLGIAAVALVAAVAAAAGIPARATYGAQVTADEPQYLLTALSLGEDGDLNIADELADERWRAFHEADLPEQTRPLPGGRRVSPHDPLLPVLLALPMTAGGWVAAKGVLVVFAAILAALTAWVAVRRFAVAPAIALPIVAVFGASAPLAAYGNQVYPELPAAVCVMAAVVGLTRPLRAGALWLLGLAVVALPWLAIKYAPVAAALTLLAVLTLLRDGRRRAALVLCGLLVLAGAVYVAVHLAVWEGITAYGSGDHFVGGEFTAVGSSPNYLGRSVRLIGLLVDREFGLAAWQPAWLLAVPAIALVWRRRPPQWQVLLVPLAAGWLNATFVALTMNGYWFPGRQTIVVLPLAVLAICVAAQASRAAAWTAVGAGLLGLWSYGWLVYAGVRQELTWVVDFMTVRDPWYRAWSAVLPAYRFPATGVWLRHAAWIVVLAGAAVLGWRLRSTSAGPGLRRLGPPDSSSRPDPEAEPDADPDVDAPSRTSFPSSPPQAESSSIAVRAAVSSDTEKRRDTNGLLGQLVRAT